MSEAGAPQQSESPSAIMRRERVCDRYEDAWRRGERPCIDDFLAEVPESERPELTRHLVELEVHYRSASESSLRRESAEFQTEYPDPIAAAFGKLEQSGDSGDRLPPKEDRPEAAPDLPRMFGRYRADTCLGKGAFGTVYLARDVELGRLVAIKVPNVERAADSACIESYLREARILARLDHPHVVPVYDVGRTGDGLCYVVSKYIEGTDLAGRLKRGRPSLLESAGLVQVVAFALHHAHGHGLVHRDVKPANILIDATGVPIVADFGLALAEEDFGGRACFAGTPAYMSPEQARGEGHRVDGRSDIFSLGVVLYELLTGHRPFRGGSQAEVLNEIVSADPPPPRTIDDTIPKELERICLKALSKRASDRYATAAEMADDLRLFVQTDAKAPEPAKSIVPKGLRSFDQDDAGFFLELLPGPRGRDGLPESIRFWKSRIEQPEADQAFRVGLLYGPSGCGKSSLVKAGLLPRLEKHVVTVFVEASGQDTETRLLNGLRKAVPGLHAESALGSSIAALRRRSVPIAGRKVLLVVDQFEQWLHAKRGEETSELVAALRQCDGEHVQALLMVRDDFWVATSRFMEAVDVKLVEGWNTALVDLFDLRHARKVLTAFGIANGNLPSRERDIPRSQHAFLDQAVMELAQDGKVISVRLALFAEMLKAKPWTPAALRHLGGTQGVGVAFLETTFSASQSKPAYRRHHKAAQAMLKALLPEAGSDIKGQMRSEQELWEVSGYASSPEDFHDLLRILENDLRLITPTEESAEDAGRVKSAGTSAAERAEPGSSIAVPGSPHRYYQLTHDYLVPALRDWLTRKQRETRRGRAELRLAERAELWRAKPQNRHLPSLGEWIAIRCFTRSTAWTDSQRQMMKQAARLHSLRVVGLATAAAGLLILGLDAWNRRAADGASRVQQLLRADIAEVPRLLANIEGHRRWTDPELRRLVADPWLEPKAKLRASLALLPVDPTQFEYLQTRLLDAEPGESVVLRGRLQPRSASLTSKLWQVLESAKAGDPRLLPAASALASFAPTDGKLEAVGDKVVRTLLSADPTFVDSWIEALRPLHGQLTAPAARTFKEKQRSESEHKLATKILANYASDDSVRLADVLVVADPTDFCTLFPLAEKGAERAVPIFQAELAPAVASWNDAPLNPAWSEPSPVLKKEIDSAGGMLAGRFAFCQNLPLAGALSLAEQLRGSGYRPTRFRPYADRDSVRAAAVWARDGQGWCLDSGLTKSEVISKGKENRKREYLPADIAGYIATVKDGKRSERYAALWVAKQGDDDADIYVGLTEDEYSKYRYKLKAQGLGPRTVTASVGGDGVARYSGVWGRQTAEDSDPRCYRNESRKSFQQKLDEESEGTIVDAAVFSAEDRHSGRGDCHYAAIWKVPVPFEAVCNYDLDPATQFEHCRRLSSTGYRPVSVSAVRTKPDARVSTASVWWRPNFSDDERDQRAERQARAAIALLRLGKGESIWPLLRHGPDPGLRSNIVNWLSPLGADPGVLTEQFALLDSARRRNIGSHVGDMREVGTQRMDAILFDADTSTRRALILALGTFEAGRFSPGTRRLLAAALLDLYKTDPDAGIHGAAEWAMRRWGEDARLDAAVTELRKLNGRGPRQWFVNTEGQTFTVIDGPVTFRMGSPPDDPDGLSSETPHRRSIPRRFAIAATEVTVQQFRNFVGERQAFEFAVNTFDLQRYSPQPQGPILGVNWQNAAIYCNWLSRKEGLDPFYKEAEYSAGAKLESNALHDRHGYRLPTEAEWEYACRAGAVTSRYYGRSLDLLGNYARYSANSQNRAWPCGQLLPNDLGLFDMLGNAFEWCQDRLGPYRRGEQGPAGDDMETLSYDDIEKTERVVRGGLYNYPPEFVRSAVRNKVAPLSGASLVGFRLAKTIN